MSKVDEDSQALIKQLELRIELLKDGHLKVIADADSREEALLAELSKYMTALQESENELASAQEMNRIAAEAMRKVFEELNRAVGFSNKLQKEHEEVIESVSKTLEDSRRECRQLREANATLSVQLQNHPLALKRQYEAGYTDGCARVVEVVIQNSPRVE